MIEHLKGRERALAALGWTGREAEWIALVCLHSGVFTRAQFCHYFEAHRKTAQRFVQDIGYSPGGGRDRMAVSMGEERRAGFQARNLPGAWSREHPPPAKG